LEISFPPHNDEQIATKFQNFADCAEVDPVFHNESTVFVYSIFHDVVEVSGIPNMAKQSI
jgi:hypothetical protein